MWILAILNLTSRYMWWEIWEKSFLVVGKLQIHCIGSVFICFKSDIRRPWAQNLKYGERNSFPLLFFCCIRIHCYFTFTFSFISGSSLLRGSSSAQLAALRSPLSGGRTVAQSKGVVPCGDTLQISAFFLFSNFRKRQIALYSPCRLVGRLVGRRHH